MNNTKPIAHQRRRHAHAASVPFGVAAFGLGVAVLVGHASANAQAASRAPGPQIKAPVSSEGLAVHQQAIVPIAAFAAAGAALPGAESQLQSHMRISMNVGLMSSQLRQLTQVLAERVDAEHARRAREALERHLAAATEAR